MSTFRFLLLTLAAALSVACASGTSLVVKSQPVGADVNLQKTGVEGRTDGQLAIPTHHYGESEGSIRETVVYRKPGFRERQLDAELRRGRRNRTTPEVIELAPLDTILEVGSTPEGTRVELSIPEDDVPPGWPTEFTTPVRLEATSFEARRLAGRIEIASIDREGYHAPTMALPARVELTPGKTTTIDLDLQPIITTLNIVTDPEGATVEDVSPGGFGFIGETPAMRNFNYEDVKLWANRRYLERDEKALNAAFQTLELTLRVAKNGYEDRYLKVQIPVGETREFRPSLQALVSEVEFESDPPGAHVYVLRDRVGDVYDAKTGEIKNEAVVVPKRLGQTPFRMGSDRNDLLHGETLMFRKPGYKDGQIRYANGEDQYHVVLEPINVGER